MSIILKKGLANFAQRAVAIKPMDRDSKKATALFGLNRVVKSFLTPSMEKSITNGKETTQEKWLNTPLLKGEKANHKSASTVSQRADSRLTIGLISTISIQEILMTIFDCVGRATENMMSKIIIIKVGGHKLCQN
jgi:hypothetical protein